MKRGQTGNDYNFNLRVGMFAMTGVRMYYHDSIYIVYMGKHRNAHLIHNK